MTQVVGWLLHRDNTCEQCKVNPAAVIVTFNGYDAVELCRNCLPEGVHGLDSRRSATSSKARVKLPQEGRGHRGDQRLTRSVVVNDSKWHGSGTRSKLCA